MKDQESWHDVAQKVKLNLTITNEKYKCIEGVTKLKKKRINMSEWMDEPMSEWDYRAFHFKHECSVDSLFGVNLHILS